MDNEKQPENVKRSVFSGVLWRFAERFGAQIVTLVVSLVLKWFVLPDEYGIVSLTMVVITLANVFVVSGFGSALIQKKETDSLDFSSVFYFNVAFSLLLFVLLFFMAPFIAAVFPAYDKTLLTAVLRVLGLRLPLAAVNNLQQAYVSRKMWFRKFFFATLWGTLFSAVVGIALAVLGCGVWAVVAQYLTNSLVDTLFLWFTVKWRPGWEFSFARLRSLLSYGWKLLLSGLIDTGYNQLRPILIGVIDSGCDLSIYDNGKQYPQVLAGNLNTAVSSVLFPVISRYQDDPARVKTMTRRSVRISSYVMFPMMLGMAAVAPSVIRLVLPESWLPSIPFWIICCVTYAFWPVHTANLEALKAVGRTDLYLRLEILKKLLGIAAIAAVLFLCPDRTLSFTLGGIPLEVKSRVLYLALSSIPVALISTFINAYPNKRLLGYRYREQLRDMAPAVVLGFLMFAAVWATYLLPLPGGRLWTALLLCGQVLLGVGLYVGLSALLRLESFTYLKELLAGLLRRRKSPKEETV